MEQNFILWLTRTSLSLYVNEHPWVWPTLESLHFIGLSLLVGTVGLFDLRMLGMAKKLPLAPLHEMVRWGIAGFVLNVATGLLFFVANPGRYLHNLAFVFKLSFILFGGINVLVFHYTLFPLLERYRAGDDAPLRGKIIAAVSLLLWIGVMYMGRMLTFMDGTFRSG